MSAAAPFAELAARVDAAWRRAGYAPAALAGVAEAALRDLELTLPQDLEELSAWLFAEPALPTQRSLDEAFGQPPVTVYVDERFFIELLFWHTGTTGIHQHAFTGAFRVLCGSSLHTVYDFHVRKEIDPRLLLGALQLRTTEVLPTGAVRQILPGSGLIHAAFHLDNPSVTLIVRSHADGTREYEYKPPHLVLDPSARDELTTKRLQLMGLLAQQPGDAYRRCVASALDRADVYAGALLLLRARRQADAATWSALFEGYARRFPEVAAELLPAANEEARRMTMIGARARIREPEHRFFLALLMNLPSRAAILDVIAQHTGAEPMPTLLRWLRDCCHRERLGFELSAPLFAVLRGLLEGCSEEEQLAHFGASDDDNVRAQLTRARAELSRILLLAPLFL